MITLSIDLRLLDQSKFKKITRKNGEAATFCDIVLIETPGSKYGDFVAKQDSTKEERESGAKTPILGNAKHLKRKEPFSAQPPDKKYPAPATAEGEDEIPF